MFKHRSSNFLNTHLREFQLKTDFPLTNIARNHIQGAASHCQFPLYFALFMIRVPFQKMLLLLMLKGVLRKALVTV